VDSTFNTGANSAVNRFVVQPDGKILVGGWFTNLAGSMRNYIGRLVEDSAVEAARDQ
jgi:hypothetical protein